MNLTKNIAIATLVIGLTLGARPAQAQLGFTFFGVGEFDTDDVTLALVGVSVARNGLGWSPTAGLQAYWLEYPSGTDTDQITAFTPSLGIRNTFGTGFAEFKVGYTFASSDSDVIPIGATVADTEDGISNTAHVEYWNDGRVGAQAIVNYNYAAETLWLRGRLTKRVLGIGMDGGIHVGGEVAYLTSPENDELAGTQALGVGAAGGLVQWHTGRGVVLGAGLGKKFGDSDATYFKFELVLTP